MYVCVICRFNVEFDDAIAPTQGGSCVCLRCFNRETGSALAMSKALRTDVTMALSQVGVAWAA